MHHIEFINTLNSATIMLYIMIQHWRYFSVTHAI